MEVAAKFMSDEDMDPAFLYSGFCMTSLPHRKLDDESKPWERVNGRFSLLVGAVNYFERFYRFPPSGGRRDGGDDVGEKVYRQAQ